MSIEKIDNKHPDWQKYMDIYLGANANAFSSQVHHFEFDKLTGKFKPVEWGDAERPAAPPAKPREKVG